MLLAFTFPLSPFRTPPYIPVYFLENSMYHDTASGAQSAELKSKTSRRYCQTKCARTKRNSFIWEGKQLSPVFLVQLTGCPGEVKASNSFLSWHFLCGSNPLPGAHHQNLDTVLDTSSRDCSNTEVLRKELLLVGTSPGQHLLHHC